MRFSEDDLKPNLDIALENTDKDSFVKSYLSGVTRALNNNPETYRSFGMYWWPLKELLLEYNINVFGDNVEAGTLSKYRMSDNALTCVAAFTYQAQRQAQRKLLASDHLIEQGDGEVDEYIIHDDAMEKMIFIKSAMAK